MFEFFLFPIWGEIDEGGRGVRSEWVDPVRSLNLQLGGPPRLLARTYTFDARADTYNFYLLQTQIDEKTQSQRTRYAKLPTRTVSLLPQEAQFHPRWDFS